MNNSKFQIGDTISVEGKVADIDKEHVKIDAGSFWYGMHKVTLIRSKSLQVYGWKYEGHKLPVLHESSINPPHNSELLGKWTRQPKLDKLWEDEG